MEQPAYVFIASGIGITPFRSIIKSLIDKEKKEKILLLYKAPKNEFLFQDIFAQAEKVVETKTVYLTDTKAIDEGIIKAYIQDPNLPTYYLSGPQHLVEAQRDMLMQLGIDGSQIKTDLFSGYD